MNADRLLTHYERIADAPDAIVRLRRFILDLAVRGKLVEQDLNDEPASIFLAGGKRCKSQEFRAADAPGWLVYPVGSLLEFKYGKGMKASERLNEGPVPVFGSNGIVGYCETPLTEAPSIIVGRKGSAGALNLCNGPSWTTDVAYFVEAPNFFDLQYLLIGLQGLALGSLGKGIKPGLSRSDAYDLPLSVPPLAEQRRIVAKVDKLMALCDRLEAARAEREATRDRLSAASLARLDVPDPDPTVFQGHAAFALKNFAPLTTRLDQTKGLRQTILNLAVRGKLVEQDPGDEPASELLKRIASERKSVPISAQKTKKRPVDSPLTEMAFPLPTGWASAQLSELVRVLNGRAYKKTELLDSGTPILRVGNLFTSNHWYYSNLEFEEDKYCDEGDLIYAWSASFGPFIWHGPSVIYHYHIWKLPLFTEENLDKQFLYFFLLQKTHEIKGAGHGISMVHMTKEKMEQLAVPLPPLAEQHRIVAKVEELMPLCDRLEASLATGDDTRRHLLDALLHEALSLSEEDIEQNISTITQELPDQSPEVLTEPTLAGTSSE